jgi:hypothetical protein
MQPFQAISHLPALWRYFIDSQRAILAYQKIVSHEHSEICLDGGKTDTASIDDIGEIFPFFAYVQDLHYDLIFAPARPHIVPLKSLKLSLSQSG